MKTMYETNQDFKDFIDANASTYGKSVEFMLQTPTAKEYAKYLKERGERREIVHEDKTCGC